MLDCAVCRKIKVPFQMDDCECGNSKCRTEKYCEECAEALGCCKTCGKEMKK